uniref:Uncharacterized protein n=1 Tax=Knipowitschia caucasica TaxID=637954 RepID=A0AAV2LP08_KNICA
MAHESNFAKQTYRLNGGSRRVPDEGEGQAEEGEEQAEEGEEQAEEGEEQAEEGEKEGEQDNAFPLQMN